jgi:hypothetical protein
VRASSRKAKSKSGATVDDGAGLISLKSNPMAPVVPRINANYFDALERPAEQST